MIIINWPHSLRTYLVGFDDYYYCHFDGYDGNDYQVDSFKPIKITLSNPLKLHYNFMTGGSCLIYSGPS